ncbi:MAG: hypothetical protein ACP5D7_17665 [Limnospira sp.]
MFDLQSLQISSRVATVLGSLWLTLGIAGPDWPQRTPPEPAIAPPPEQLAQTGNCPTELDTLTAELVKDLPAYANRVIQRSPPRPDPRDPGTSIIFAVALPSEPLPIAPDLPASDDLQTAFIATRERFYQNSRAIAFRRYHWLFLRRSGDGWELVKLYSKSDPYPGYKILPQPWDSSKSAIARAIDLWLRDCEGGN